MSSGSIVNDGIVVSSKGGLFRSTHQYISDLTDFKTRNELTILQPVSTYSTDFTGTINFKIQPSDGVDRINQVFLRLQILNANAATADVTLTDGCYVPDKVTYYIGNQRMFEVDRFTNPVFHGLALDSEDYDERDELENLGKDTVVPDDSAATITLWCDITGPWYSAGVVASALQEPIRLEIQMGSGTAYVIKTGETAAGVSITGCTLAVMHTKLPTVVLEKYKIAYGKGFRMLFFEPQHQYKADTLTASTKYTLRLDGIHGMAYALFVYHQTDSAPDSAEDYYTYASKTTAPAYILYDLKNTSGQSLINSSVTFKDKELISQFSSGVFPNDWLLDQGIVPISKCPVPYTCFWNAVPIAPLPMSGNELLEVTSTATISSGMLHVVALIHRYCDIVGGKVVAISPLTVS